jgi:SM-20-related protein
MPTSGVFQQLGLFVLPNFLQPECAAEFCRQMIVAPAKKALVVGPEGEGRLDLDFRKVDSSTLPEEIITPLKQRLLQLSPELERHFGVKLAGCEGPEYLIYHPGDFFKPHVDGGPQSRDSIRRRRVSAVIFLNRQSQEPADDAYGDGHLTFYGLLDGPQWEKCALPLDAEPGLLIAFPSDKWHEVKLVSHGRRFTAVTWFYAHETLAEGTD